MNWLHRNNPFQDDRDRYGYPPSGYDQADMSYHGYGYDSYANSSRRPLDYDYGYEAPPTYPTVDSVSSSYDRYERYERDERDERYSSYAEQPAYSRYRNYEEAPFGYNSYDGRSFGDEREDALCRTRSNAYDFRQQVTTTAVAEPAVEVTAASEDVLVRIRGAMVHLVNDQESPLLAEGDFSVVRIEQEGNGIVAFVRVGDNLRWPLTKDEPAVKLDSGHYFFTIRVPRRVDDMDRETAGSSQECLSYGVTFSTAGQERQLRELDAVLEQYSGFSAPELVHGDSDRDEFDGAFGYGHGHGHNQPPRGRPVPASVVSNKQKPVKNLFLVLHQLA